MLKCSGIRAVDPERIKNGTQTLSTTQRTRAIKYETNSINAIIYLNFIHIYSRVRLWSRSSTTIICLCSAHVRVRMYACRAIDVCFFPQNKLSTRLSHDYRKSRNIWNKNNEMKYTKNLEFRFLTYTCTLRRWLTRSSMHEYTDHSERSPHSCTQINMVRHHTASLPPSNTLIAVYLTLCSPRCRMLAWAINYKFCWIWIVVSLQHDWNFVWARWNYYPFLLITYCIPI